MAKRIVPDPPADLTGPARDRWLMLAKKISKASDPDWETFEHYCRVWARWKQAEDGLTAAGQLTKTKGGNIVPSPLVALAKASSSEVRALEDQLGIRKKVANGKNNPRSLAQPFNNATSIKNIIRGDLLSMESHEEPLPDFSEVPDVQKQIYLQALCRTPQFHIAARAAGICIKTGWNWRTEPDPVFQAAFKKAWAIGIERAEAELFRRGVDGYAKPVYHLGQLVGAERVFDTTALIFALKGALPEKYRERIGHEMSGPGGGPIANAVAVAVYDGMSTDELEARWHRMKLALDKADAIDTTTVSSPVLHAARSTDEVDAEMRRLEYEATLKKRNGGGNGHG